MHFEDCMSSNTRTFGCRKTLAMHVSSRNLTFGATTCRNRIHDIPWNGQQHYTSTYVDRDKPAHCKFTDQACLTELVRGLIVICLPRYVNVAYVPWLLMHRHGNIAHWSKQCYCLRIIFARVSGEPHCHERHVFCSGPLLTSMCLNDNSLKSSMHALFAMFLNEAYVTLYTTCCPAQRKAVMSA